MEAKGKLYTVFETKQISDRFRKRDFVVELADNPRYPQFVLFQATGDRCSQLDEFQDGDEVRVEFSLRGREWRSPSGEVKYFNTLDVWKVERVGTSRSEPQRRSPTHAPASTAAPDARPPLGPDDDIPF